jgi:hypothetical protein
MYITEARVDAEVSSNRDLFALLRAIREMAETRRSRVLSRSVRSIRSRPPAALPREAASQGLYSPGREAFVD